MHVARGEAEAVGADHARAVAAHECQELALGPGAVGAGLGESGRDHAHRPHAGGERGLDRRVDRGGRHADDHEVDGLGHLLDAVHRRHPGDGLPGAVDGERPAGEPALDDVAEHGPADRARPRRRADHGHRPRLEERLERPADGGVVTAVDSGEEAVTGRDPQPHLDLAPLERPLDVVPRVGEHLQHRVVVGHDVGHERLDTLLGGRLGELLDQPRADAQSLQLGGHGEGRLGQARVAQAGIARDGHHLVAGVPAQQADQRPARAPVGVEQAVEDVVADPARAVEAHIQAPVVEPAEEVEHRLGVVGQRRAQPQRPAVPENDVTDVRHDR